jgi:hypothetical protein
VRIDVAGDLAQGTPGSKQFEKRCYFLYMTCITGLLDPIGKFAELLELKLATTAHGCLTVKLRGRPEALDQAPRAHTGFSARGALMQAFHGPLQRLLDSECLQRIKLSWASNKPDFIDLVACTPDRIHHDADGLVTAVTVSAKLNGGIRRNSQLAHFGAELATRDMQFRNEASVF